MFLNYGSSSDHIVTMQQSLAQYERILSHSHPAYLSHLRYSLSNAKGGIDNAILTLTGVSITCFSIQFVLSKSSKHLSSGRWLIVNPSGLMSTNINVPHNRRPDDDPSGYDGPTGHFYAFGGVFVFVTLLALSVLALIRYWWRKAKRKYRKHHDI